MFISYIYDNFYLKLKAKALLFRKEVDLRIAPFTIGFNRFYSDNESALVALVSEVKKDGIEIAITK